MSTTGKRQERKAAHRELTRMGVPRTKDGGNRLGLRKRRQLAAARGGTS